MSRIEDILDGGKSALVVLFIPSHDKNNCALTDPMNDQRHWTAMGKTLLADLYNGATAFPHCEGIFKNEAGQYLYDSPIVLLETFVNQQQLHDASKMNQVFDFLKTMGKATKQDTVMCVLNGVVHFIPEKDF
jgi:hypothetical protein